MLTLFLIIHKTSTTHLIFTKKCTIWILKSRLNYAIKTHFIFNVQDICVFLSRMLGAIKLDKLVKLLTPDVNARSVTDEKGTRNTENGSETFRIPIASGKLNIPKAEVR